ncbi:MAG: bactofilin family protein [Acidobacteriota bacterium]
METRIDAGSRLKGTLETADDLLLEGVLVGEVRSTARVVIARGARLEGPLSARDVEVGGTVEGPVTATGWVAIRSGGRVAGDIRAGHILVEDGAVVQGRVLAGETSGGGR